MLMLSVALLLIGLFGVMLPLATGRDVSARYWYTCATLVALGFIAAKLAPPM